MLDLNEIKTKKGVPNYYKVYSEQEMEDIINKAFLFRYPIYVNYLTKCIMQIMKKNLFLSAYTRII